MQGLTREDPGLQPASSSSENDADESSAEEVSRSRQTQKEELLSEVPVQEEHTGDKGEHGHQTDGNVFSDLFSDFSSLDSDGDQRKQESLAVAENDDIFLNASSNVHPISDRRESVQDTFDGTTTASYSGEISPESVEKESRVSEDWPQRPPSRSLLSETDAVQSKQTPCCVLYSFACVCVIV